MEELAVGLHAILCLVQESQDEASTQQDDILQVVDKKGDDVIKVVGKVGHEVKEQVKKGTNKVKQVIEEQSEEVNKQLNYSIIIYFYI